MKVVPVLTAVAASMLAALSGAAPQPYALGGAGDRWSQAVDFQSMVDTAAVAGAIQPIQIVPGQNIASQLGPWWERRSPKDVDYREGQPRVWQGVNATASAEYSHQTPTSRWVDGDPATFTELSDAQPHFYTLDLGAPIYADRFVFYPPAHGRSATTGDPFYPKYVLQKYALYGSATQERGQLLEEELKGTDYDPEVDFVGTGECCPLELLLGAEDSHLDTVAAILFPLQRLRFFRLLLQADSFRPDGTAVIDHWANAEMEVYGRGFAPEGLWQSRVIDLGGGVPVTMGRVYYDVSHWRQDPESGVLTEVEPGGSDVAIELQTGTDGDPVAHFIYNDLGGLSEAPREVWMGLDDADILGGTEGPGYRGPRTEDRENWSFWSKPLPASGALPRMPVGRYLRLRLRLLSDSPWEFARVHSVRIERGPLLAERIVGEAARRGAPEGGADLAVLRAGFSEPVVVDLRAEFSGPGQRGFDAIRLLSSVELQLDSLAVGSTTDGFARVIADSVVHEAGGLAVYLPPGHRIQRGGDTQLRLHLGVRLFGAASQLSAEVFDRSAPDLAQQVSEGDAGPELSSNRMLVVAAAGTAVQVLGGVQVTPQVVTPQGDGINDVASIEYSVFQILGLAAVQVSVHRLDGAEVWRAPAAEHGAGRQQVLWPARTQDGNLVAPGLYLVRVEVDAEVGRSARIQSVAVAY